MFTLDLGSLVALVLEKVQGYLALSSEDRALHDRLLRRIRLCSEEASTIQCIGMPKGIPFAELYQESRLLDPDERKITPEALTQSAGNSIVFGGPGSGKSTLLSWLYLRLATSDYTLPILFVVRSMDSVDDLVALVSKLIEVRVKHAKLKREDEQLSKREAELALEPESELSSVDERAQLADALTDRVAAITREREKLLQSLRAVAPYRITLLVDGYDEVGESDRRRVSRALSELAASRAGSYVLTCRTYYEVIDLKAEHYYMAPFSAEDTVSFIDRFSRLYGRPIEGADLVQELNDRGFSDFLCQPLMLTLVCLLRTSANSEISRSTIGIIRRALEILTFRWDEAKGIKRASQYSLDGQDRLRCLMRIAYFMELDRLSQESVERVIAEYLDLAQVESVAPAGLLLELAQWYGLLHRDGGFNWQFKHKTIHDYLAARHWVESAAFMPTHVVQWTTRAAYAACLVPDATQSLICALRFSKEISAFVEALANSPPFRSTQVADAVVEHFDRFRPFVHNADEDGSSRRIETWQDFWPFASDKFINDLLVSGLRRGGVVGDLIVAYSGQEIIRRGRSVTSAEVPPLIRSRPQSAADTIVIVRQSRRVEVVISKIADLWEGPR